MFFIPTEEFATYVLGEHALYSFFEARLLVFRLKSCKAFPSLSSLASPQDIIVKLQGIQHSQVGSDCYCRYTFLYSRHGQWRASSTFRNLGNTQIPAQTSQFNLLSYNRHLLHQFSRQFGSHCILCHNQLII